ncbi:hypothetical protein DSO57_1009447 [Entomophthora muscae]|uniref:Uncharacterized protein n=1 Tax=Entomophthora muscae TaxID=34485 RepID=A0ACC2THQ5_9FUNG|nr:hypothetical protein DSO57_1009447 [Entomophthora muscae]
MVFTINKPFDSLSKQGSSQESVSGGVAWYVEAPVYTQIFNMGWDLNPDPELLQATGPEDQGAACPSFPGVEFPQAEAKNDCLKGEASQTKEIITPDEGVIKAPNRGNKIPTICFMDLENALVANQDVSPEKSTSPGPDPMTATQ